MKTSPLEAEMALQIRAAKLPDPLREHRFHPTRRWRFDFCWPEAGIALEIDGATWTGGRHTRGSGYQADCEKLNEAAVLGWRVFRATRDMVKSGYALRLLEAVLV
jgi:very-short-patch-repair endonuclease